VPIHPRRKSTHENIRLSLNKHIVAEIDSQITTNPALGGYNRIGFITTAICYALDSLHEVARESDAENTPCTDIEIKHQHNVSETNTAFEPYIHAVGEDSVPRGITNFSLLGGYERWTTIRVPASILSLPVAEQLQHVPELTKNYLEEYGGQAPFFGAVTAFLYVGEFDHYEFDRDGILVSHIEEVFSRGSVSISMEDWDGDSATHDK
jgi:hypothetical protein